MPLIRFTATLSLALLLAACGGSDGDRSARPDSAVATPSIVEEGEHDHPSQAADPSLTVRPDGVGPVRVGMTMERARTALGHFRLIRFDYTAPIDSMACAYGMSVRLPPGVRMMVEGARVVRVDVDSGAVATAEGARVGDTEARIQQLYAGRVQVQPHKYTDGHYLVVRPAEASDTTHLLIFETDGRVVQRFRGGQKPQVEYVEGCA
jgi:hypothetical protein